jgi:hypothetical protein
MMVGHGGLSQLRIKLSLNRLQFLIVVSLNVVFQGEALHFLYLSEDDFSGKLAEIFYFNDPWIVKLRQKQSFSPKILVKIKLLKLLVIHVEKVENVFLEVLKNGIGLDPKSVIQIVNVKIIEGLVPAADFLLFAFLRLRGAHMLMRVYSVHTHTFRHHFKRVFTQTEYAGLSHQFLGKDTLVGEDL